MTSTPDATLDRVLGFFRQQRADLDLSAIGIGSFGPVDLDPLSSTYGYITSTPKRDWENVNLIGTVQHALELPVALDTDVNAAAFGEWTWGAARGLATFLYITVGTGIGGGGMAEGRRLHGLRHPEMGHVLVRRDAERDPYPGRCPFHGDCLEGLASGPAIGERWGTAAESLPDDHPAWPLEADYLAQAIVNYVCILSPERIIIGGGVMRRRQLFRLIRERVGRLLSGYVQVPGLGDDVDGYIMPPALGQRAGVLGALALARDLLSPAP